MDVSTIGNRSTHGNIPKIPYLDGSILTSCDKPLPLRMEAYGRDVGVVPLESDQLNMPQVELSSHGS